MSKDNIIIEFKYTHMFCYSAELSLNDLYHEIMRHVHQSGMTYAYVMEIKLIFWSPLIYHDGMWRSLLMFTFQISMKMHIRIQDKITTNWNADGYVRSVIY